MQPLKAHVKDGRLVMDEPTDLPEGEVVYLQPADAKVAIDDPEFDKAEQARLDQALDDGIAAARAGDHVDAADFVNELLARR